MQDEGADTVEANEQLALPVDSRDYLQCAEVLFDLGLKVISNNPGKLKALEEAELEIVERISIEVPAGVRCELPGADDPRATSVTLGLVTTTGFFRTTGAMVKAFAAVAAAN